MDAMTCIVPGCTVEARCRGNCPRHEQEHRRIAAKVALETGDSLSVVYEELARLGKWLPRAVNGRQVKDRGNETERELIESLQRRRGSHAKAASNTG